MGQNAGTGAGLTKWKKGKIRNMFKRGAKVQDEPGIGDEPYTPPGTIKPPPESSAELLTEEEMNALKKTRLQRFGAFFR